MELGRKPSLKVIVALGGLQALHISSFLTVSPLQSCLSLEDMNHSASFFPIPHYILAHNEGTRVPGVGKLQTGSCLFLPTQVKAPWAGV